MTEDSRAFADMLIDHMMSRKKHHYIQVVSALILFVLTFTFVVFLLTPIPIWWDPLFDLKDDQNWSLTERVAPSETTVANSTVTNSTAATGSAEYPDGDPNESMQYDVTIYVWLLVLAPFMVAAYLLYLGVSGVLFYKRWDEKYQKYLEKTKSLGAELDDVL